MIFYYSLFLIVAIVRGKIKWSRSTDGHFHLSDLFKSIASALTVPLIFTVLGIIPMLFLLECASDNPNYCESSRDEFCLEYGSCDGIVVMDDQFTRDINWTHTIMNAYFKIPVAFQFLVIIVIAMIILYGTISGIVKLLKWILIPALRFVRKQAKKIPIRF
jgi:hypothetical protein